MSRILIAEDDPAIGSFLAKGLRAAGFTALLAEDGDEAEDYCLSGEFDLVILDMGLPIKDGLAVLRAIRDQGVMVPVLVLTGRPERDVVACLDAGADDYMIKPFRFDELLARVRTRLRSSNVERSSSLAVGSLSLDLRTRRATIGDRRVELTAREFSLLEALMRHPDQVLSREQLLSQVWGYYFDPTTNLVNVYVNALRKKLGPDVIETVRGAGYRVRAEEPVAPRGHDRS